MKLVIFIFFIFFQSLFAQENAGSFVKEKREIMALKKELNQFYNLKEEEYKKRKQELDAILSKIKSERSAIQRIRDDNNKILADIKGQVESKTALIFNKMKPKNAAEIFDKMMKDGKIEDVFDIILKLKEQKVTAIMKFLDIKNASRLTEKLLNYRVEDQKRKDNNG